MNCTYGEMLTKGKFTINKRMLFEKLQEKDEILITREIVNFFLWANKNLNMIKEFLKKQDINLYFGDIISKKELVGFWLKYIGKSDEIEELLTDVSVIADVYEYANLYYNSTIKYPIDFEIKMVSYQKYRTKAQYSILKDILDRQDYKSRLLLKRLKENKCDINHIDKAIALKLINEIRKL